MSTKQQGNTNENLKLKYVIRLILSICTTCKYLGIKRVKFLRNYGAALVEEQGNSLLSTELITYRLATLKNYKANVSSLGPFSEPWQWANTRNISFITLYGELPTQLITLNYPIWGLLTHVTHDEISNSKLDIFTIFCKWVDNGFIWTLIIINCRDFQNCCRLYIFQNGLFVVGL